MYLARLFYKAWMSCAAGHATPIVDPTSVDPTSILQYPLHTENVPRCTSIRCSTAH